MECKNQCLKINKFLFEDINLSFLQFKIKHKNINCEKKPVIIAPVNSMIGLPNRMKTIEMSTHNIDNIVTNY